MKNKKGFTLVELLAVIVILAIIALITIPIVVHVINESQENADKQSILNYAKAVEQDIINWKLEDSSRPVIDYKNEYLNRNINVSGDKVKCEKITISTKGKINLFNCYLETEEENDKQYYDYIDGKVIKQDNQNDNENDNQNNNQNPSTIVYKVGDKITVGYEDYYVIKESGKDQDYVTALKENPLKYDEVKSIIGRMAVNSYAYFSGSSTDVGVKSKKGFATTVYYSSSTCGYVNKNFVTTNCKSNYDDSIVREVIDKWQEAKFKNNELKLVDGYTARLITFDEVYSLGYNTPSSCSGGDCYYTTENVPFWVYNGMYYRTMTPYNGSSEFVWCISDDGNLSRADAIYQPGYVIRPVINVNKNKIQD